MKQLIVFLVGGFITGCVTGYNPAYYFNEIVVVNRAGAEIRDVDLRIVNSPVTLNCAEVAEFAICHDLFGKRLYPQQGIELNWTHPDGSRKIDTSNPHVPAYFSPSFALRIVLEINQDGSVKSFHEQEDRGRERLIGTARL